MKFSKSILPAAFIMGQLSLAGDAPPKLTATNGHLVILIPAGKFTLGEEGSRRNPEHQSELKSFAIAETETTNAQFSVFVAAKHYVTSAEKRGGMVFQEGMKDWKWKKDTTAKWSSPFGDKRPRAEEQPNHPVTQVSAVDAVAYCN